MRASPLHPLWVSTSPPGRDRLARIALHGAAAFVFAVLAIYVNVIGLRTFYKLRASGHDVFGTVDTLILDKRQAPTLVWAFQHETRTYGFRVRYADSGGSLHTAILDVDKSDADAYAAATVRLHSPPGDPGPFRNGPYPVELTVTDSASPLAALSHRVGAPRSVAAAGAIGIVLALAYAWGSRLLRPWYERRRVDDVEPDFV